jgi:hypothetical protein
MDANDLAKSAEPDLMEGEFLTSSEKLVALQAKATRTKVKVCDRILQQDFEN